MTWHDLLLRIDRLGSAEAFNRVQNFVNLNGLHLLRQKPDVNNVAEILSLWQVRYKNTAITDVAIPGASELIRNLMQMPPDAEIEQYGFTGEKLAGSIFLERQTGEFLGDTIVERRPKSQEMLQLEAELLQPSRKSA